MLKARATEWAFFAVVFTAATLVSWTPLAVQINNDAYDWLSRLHPQPPRDSESVVLAIDEASFSAFGGVGHIRDMVAQALELARGEHPASVAIDVILADPGDAQQDQRLSQAMKGTPKLTLAATVVPGGARWDEPLPAFEAASSSVGHAHASLDPFDSVCRQYSLEWRAAGKRRWALALEALRLRRGQKLIESPDVLQLGSLIIPSKGERRQMLIRFQGNEAIPRLSLLALSRDPTLRHRLAGRTIFLGITALSAARDSVNTPQGFGDEMPGVELHAHAYETLVRGDFLRPVDDLVALLLGAATFFGVLAPFLKWRGWPSYAFAGALLTVAHTLPHLLFLRGWVVPYFTPVLAGWAAAVSGAVWQHFADRRRMNVAEDDRARYQQAIHMVTHEMRTPLTAIQGSSELMGRYQLKPEKQQELAGMINAESKRLARMIQTFLDVERLTSGHVELRTESIEAQELIESCLQRVHHLAGNKQIAIRSGPLAPGTFRGDRELLEYALYNVMTNAVKYSPPETTVTISATASDDRVRVAVADQGMGMEADELKRIFTKFYRTHAAEHSGEVGTGIGLSLVKEIMQRHGGNIEVESSPGKGSCFTLWLPKVTDSNQAMTDAEPTRRK